MSVKMIAVPISTIVSSFTTYSSCEIAAAATLVPRTTDPVFVRSELPGRLSMRALARCSGGWRAVLG
jgi:hypothetical protein